MLQPLKPVAIERYHLLDTHDRYPNCIFGRFFFSGEINLDAAREALEQLADQHPLAQCTYDRETDRWLWQEDRDEAFHESDSWPPVAADFDIEQKIGNRFSFHVSDGKTFLQTQTHHALLDGLAGVSCVSDWLVHYARLITGDDVGRIREHEQNRLKQRGKLNLLNRGMLLKFPLQTIALFGAAKFMFRKVSPISGEENSTGNEKDRKQFPTFLSHVVDPIGTKKLKQKAKLLNASVVEVLLADWFIAQVEWRKKHALHDDRDWIRAMVPMNIRSKDDLKLSACNRVSMIQLDRMSSDLNEYQALVCGIKREMSAIRQWKLDRTFLLAIKMLSWLPGIFRRTLKSDVCRATSVLSSLGDPFKSSRLPTENGKVRAGNLLLDRFDLAAPVRPKTAVSIATSRYAHSLQFTMHYDYQVLSEKQASELFNEFICRLDGARI